MPVLYTPGFGRRQSANRGILYESVFNIIGLDAVIVPAADPRYGALSAATFLTTGDARIVVTPDDPLQDWTIPPGIAGIVPTIDFGGQASSGDLLSVAANAAWENPWDGGGAIGCWVNIRSDGANNEGRLWSGNRWSFQSREESSGAVKLRLVVAFSGDNGIWTTSATAITLNQSSFVVVLYDADAVGNDPVIYVDGVSQAITEDQAPTGTRASNSEDTFTVGNLPSATHTMHGRQLGGALGLFIKRSTLSGNHIFRLTELGLAAQNKAA